MSFLLLIQSRAKNSSLYDKVLFELRNLIVLGYLIKDLTTIINELKVSILLSFKLFSKLTFEKWIFFN